MNNRPQLAEPLDRDLGTLASLGMPDAAPLPSEGQMLIVTQGREVTARKVAVPRSLARIRQELAVYCAAFGDTYVYSWDVKNRREGTRQTIEGGTIKLANDLVQLYGNCATDCDVTEASTHWTFKAFFIDYERGTTTARLFQQRKGQDIGSKYDAERARDMVFQIGQSKAQRNVVLNALSSLANYAIEQAKKNLLDKFGDEENAKKAHEFIDRVAAEKGIDLKRVEAVAGRTRDKWTVRDLAKVYMEMRGIFEGLASPDDIYPTSEDAAEVMAEKQADKADRKRQSKPTAAKIDGKPTPPSADAKTAAKAEPSDIEKADAAMAADPFSVTLDKNGKPKIAGQAKPADMPAEARGADADPVDNLFPTD